MEKQNSPGLWIAAAALAAVVVMLLVMPGKKEPAPDRTNTPNKPDTANVTQPPKPAGPATTVKPAPLAPSAQSASLPVSTPPTPIKPIDPDDAPPPPPPKPMIPAEREATRQVLDNIQFALRDFRTALGGNPVGTNAEITSSLLGNNLKQVKIPLPDGSTVNGSGELCDPWGTPYFFHQMSATKMEIRSAGPDKQMHTPDDVTM